MHEDENGGHLPVESQIKLDSLMFLNVLSNSTIIHERCDL